MKLRKKKKKDIINKYNIRKSILILIMLICMIVAMITYWVYAYHHKYGKFYFDEVKIVSHKISDYVEVRGNIVYLKNIDEEIINNFTDVQENIISTNNIISVDITKELEGNILSIVVNYTLSNNTNSYDEILTINVDLKKNKQLTNDELLDKVNTNYKQIATKIFDENIKLPNDSNIKVKDAINDEEMTVKQFNDNKEKYIIRIREKLPEILKLYIEDNKVYAVVKLSEIDKVCYYNNIKDRLVNIKIEIGKI